MMALPSAVTACMDRLRSAGYAAYAVGGCVRDALLGLTPHDYDLCSNATPAQLQQVFGDFSLVLAGEKHGTVGVVMDGQVLEITTFRTEGSYPDHRHPDRVVFVGDIREDLARRDFTVNAMAYAPETGLVDPFGGRVDLEKRILRAVGDPATRFQEDALRILRGARFAARFRLTPEPETERAMNTLAPLLENLARERVFDELCKLLPWVTAGDLCRWQTLITQVLPELTDTVDFQQHSRFHAYDIYTHTAHTVAAAPGNLALRWAALLHDTGKPGCFALDENGQGHFHGHARESARLADIALTRLKAPTALKERVVFLVDKHMSPLCPDRKLLRRRLSQYGEEAVLQLLALQKADTLGTGKAGDAPDYAASEELLKEILAENGCLQLSSLAVNGHDLLALGYRGPEIGRMLQWLLDRVLEETLENTRPALLDALKKRQEEPL